MAIALKNDQLERIGRHWEYHIIGAFSGTDATVEVNQPLGKITGHQLSAIGTPAADEILSLTETVANNAIRLAIGSKAVTVTRTGASKTSNLAFSLTLKGEV